MSSHPIPETAREEFVANALTDRELPGQLKQTLLSARGSHAPDSNTSFPASFCHERGFLPPLLWSRVSPLPDHSMPPSMFGQPNSHSFSDKPAGCEAFPRLPSADSLICQGTDGDKREREIHATRYTHLAPQVRAVQLQTFSVQVQQRKYLEEPNEQYTTTSNFNLERLTFRPGCGLRLPWHQPCLS